MDTDYKKRRAVRQRLIRRRRMLIAFFVFIVISLMTLVILCFTTFFPIKQVKVTKGSKIYSAEQIIAASKLVSNKKQMLTLSEEDVENTIRSSLPYVEEISIKKDFPDTVQIRVTDAKESAFFKSGKKYYILSQSGFVLKTQDKAPEKLFEIVTSGMSGEVGKCAVYKDSAQEKTVSLIVSELSKNKIKINKLDVKSNIKITVEVEDKFAVNLGRNEYLDRKIAHLATMLEELGDKSGEINLSVWTPQNKHGIFSKNS